MIEYILTGIISFIIVVSYIHYVKFENECFYFDFNSNDKFRKLFKMEDS